mgnify:CR=1 FL=1
MTYFLKNYDGVLLMLIAGGVKAHSDKLRSSYSV